MREEVMKLMSDCMRDTQGDLRFICAALAVLNYTPHEIIESKPKGSFRAQGNIRSFLTTRKVTLKVPAKTYRQKQRIDKALKETKKELEREAVRVRGHCRTIIHKRDHVRRRKSPDGIIHEQIVKAGPEVVFVKEHYRGDQSKGLIEHVYQIEKNHG